MFSGPSLCSSSFGKPFVKPFPVNTRHAATMSVPASACVVSCTACYRKSKSADTVDPPSTLYDLQSQLAFPPPRRSEQTAPWAWILNTRPSSFTVSRSSFNYLLNSGPFYKKSFSVHDSRTAGKTLPFLKNFGILLSSLTRRIVRPQILWQKPAEE